MIALVLACAGLAVGYLAIALGLYLLLVYADARRDLEPAEGVNFAAAILWPVTVAMVVCFVAAILTLRAIRAAFRGLRWTFLGAFGPIRDLVRRVDETGRRHREHDAARDAIASPTRRPNVRRSILDEPEDAS